ncbi:MAG: hypothetical protein HQL42_13055 [Alphaproteobacteria bacterium]|nr:hypothetical protein [Alphaproteobacteria bacterium]
MNAITPFDFEGQPVRVIRIDDDPWFVAKDVALVLDLDTAAVGRTVESEDRGLHTVQTPSGSQQMVTVNESGLYCMIFKSRKPAAKKFKRWVTADVLPAIRRTGRYQAAPAPAPMSPADFDRPEIGTMIALVRECRATWGRTAAQRLWRGLPLPQPDRAALSLGLSPEQEWWRARLVEGSPVPGLAGWPEIIRCDVVQDAWCGAAGGGDRDRLAALFGRALHVMVPGLGRRRMSGIGRHRPWAYVLPPLEECRAAFERLTGQSAR